jgi:hypothetical protein
LIGLHAIVAAGRHERGEQVFIALIEVFDRQVPRSEIGALQAGAGF